MATTNTVNETVIVKFVINEKGNPPGKLADGELHFTDGVLAGLSLIGFGVWERRSGTSLRENGDHYDDGE